jgi:hypothetical protein
MMFVALMLLHSFSHAMGHTLLFHQLIYHPCLQGRLWGVGFGAWRSLV